MLLKTVLTKQKNRRILYLIAFIYVLYVLSASCQKLYIKMRFLWIITLFQNICRFTLERQA